MPIGKMVTVIIKSFLRPQSLYLCYKSIRLFYPDIPIVIVDDSGYWNSIFQEISEDPNVKFIQIDFDSGISKGRNVAVSNVKTDYFILCDDDFVFTEDTKIEKLIKPLKKYDICGGLVASPHKEGIVEKWTGRFVFTDQYIRLEKEEKIPIYFDDVVVYETDLTLNFFAAKTKVIQSHPWDETFKISREHLDSFLAWYYAGLKVCWTPNVVCGHIKDRPEEYKIFRARMHSDDFVKKWNKESQVSNIIELKIPHQSPNDILRKVNPNLDRKNVLIIGSGRCGTTIVTKMLEKLGWNTGDIDENYYEHRDILNMCEEVFDKDQALKIIDGIRSPWVIKQPRLCDQWNSWSDVFNQDKTILIVIERDLEATVDSMYRAGWGSTKREITYNFIKDRQRKSRTIFDQWNGSKFFIKYEDLQAAMSLWGV